VFRAAWSTRRAGGPGRFDAGSRSTLAVPPFVYRHGYDVRVTGAHVVSRPDAATLVVVEDAGAAAVSVVVRPH